jgi:hypothetical protein
MLTFAPSVGFPSFAALLQTACVTFAVLLSAARAGAALTVSTNFEGGSALLLGINASSQTISITPGGNPDRGWPCWWYLRVGGVDVNKPLFVKVVANTSAGSSEGGAKHEKLGANWSLPSRAAVSTNRTDWDQTEIGERHGGEITYRIEPKTSMVWLAWGPPFTLRDARTFLTAAAEKHAFASCFSLARSRGGNSVPALQVQEGSLPESRRPVIWVLARQHAWEVGGTWVGIGFAEWLTSDDERAKRLRSEAEVFFVPVMDADRVVTGDGGKESIPHDHNEDWSESPHYPEVAAVEKRIVAQVKKNRMALLVDLHDPNNKAAESQLWVTPTNLLSTLAARNQDRLIEACRGEILSPLPFPPEGHLIWDSPGAAGWWKTAWHNLTCPWVYEHANSQTVAVTLEVPWNTSSSTTKGYRAVGDGLGRAIERYMRERTMVMPTAGGQ